MELVPVIYNSLLIVFTLLSLVIVGSLICSKLLFCGVSKSKRVKVRAEVLSRTKPAVQNKVIKKKEIGYRKSQPKIERKLIDNKKVRIISRAENRKKRIAENLATNNVSRYIVVNTASNERSSRRSLYHKFSKMSIEYSQST